MCYSCYAKVRPSGLEIYLQLTIYTANIKMVDENNFFDTENIITSNDNVANNYFLWFILPCRKCQWIEDKGQLYLWLSSNVAYINILL